MNRGSSAESGPRALDAARAFVQRNFAPLLGIEAAGLQNFRRIVHFGTARIADQTHQSLRQYAVQRRYKVVGFDAHVQEAPDHVDDVVGVDGGEHQVSGQCGLNRDLCRFGVADFADHDLVGVVAQDRTQASSEGQAFLFIDGNLRNATELVFDRVFNRDDLVFVRLDLVHGGIERRRFTRTRRARHQHHAVRFLNVAAEAPQIVLVEADNVECEGSELLAHRLLVEHAEHRVLAVNGWHDRNAEVDGASVVLDAEAAVLRHAALGNVELAHDLDTGNHRRMVLFPDGRHSLCEHAVNTELDHDGVVAGLNVNVGSAPLQGGENRRIDEADDRAGVARRRQFVDRQGFFRARVLVFADDGEAFAGFFENALRLLGLLQDVGDLLKRGYLGDDALLQQQADLVDHHQLAGVGNGDGQLPVTGLFQRHEVVAEHQFDGDFLEQLVVKLIPAEIDELAAVTPRHVLGAFEVRDRVPGRTDRAAVATAYEERFLIRCCHLLNPDSTDEPHHG